MVIRVRVIRIRVRLIRVRVWVIRLRLRVRFRRQGNTAHTPFHVEEPPP
jgi:hypothetical protein